MTDFLILPLALLLDAWPGDPPNRWHPVAWMGQALGRAQNHAPSQNAAPSQQLFFGAGVVVAGAAAAAGAGGFFIRLARALPWLPALLVQALALKMTLSLRGLTRAAQQIQQALQRGDAPAARHWLSWHLVSRDTSGLDETQIVAATIESVAENASDGLVAPLFFYALGGLPAALAYRFLNTADAMWGYRSPRYEWLGKIPALLDDAVNFVPARLTALLLVVLAPARARAWRIWQRDAKKTTSPNAGHPMSAMAGAVGVRLEKEKHYVLGAELVPPQARDIDNATHLLQKTVWAATALFAVLLWLRMKPFQHGDTGGIERF